MTVEHSITEAEINAAMSRLAEEATYTQLWERFLAEQDALAGYFFSAQMDAFTHEEQDYLRFLVAVVFDLSPARPPISVGAITEAEERNWEMWLAAPTGKFSERINVFFEQYPQEDLLAFVEDALEPGSDTPVTLEGRPALFILLKSCIDLLQLPFAPAQDKG